MFRDRAEAGEALAEAVARAAPPDPVVLALPRGGVPPGAQVARRLGAELDLLLVRKIGLPGHDELAAGALVDGDPPTILFNDEVLRASGLKGSDFDARIAALRAEIARRRALYLKDRAPVPLAGRTAILVDDGVATGATVRTAIRALRARVPGPDAIWVAVPVAPRDTLHQLEAEADRVICLEVPDPFWAVGAHYRAFPQVGDGEVIAALDSARPAAKDGRGAR